MRQAIGLITRRLSAIRRDADDELQSVLEERTAYFVARGMTHEAARAEAIRRLGGSLEEARQQLRASAERRERRLSLREWLGSVTLDLRHAARGLRRDPLFALFAVASLALGIGANAAMFGVVDKLLLQGPAHVREPDRVVRLYWTMRQPGGELATTAAFDARVYANLLAEARAFSGIAMMSGARRSTLFGEGDGARLLTSAMGTANLMAVLGAQPVLGRFFTVDEQEADAPPLVVVLGYGVWQNDLGGTHDIVGRTVTIGSRPYTVVGVAPAGFTGDRLDRVDLWLPLPAKTGPADRHWRPGHSSGPAIIARLRDGITREDASLDATRAFRHTYDGGEPRYAAASISAGQLRYGADGTESTEARMARWLAGLSAVVLLLVCANVANLQLARAIRHRRELAVRIALGAGRLRVLRLLLANSLLLALLGAVAGLVVSFASETLVRRVLLPDVDWSSSPVDSHVLIFTLLAAVVTGVVIGLVPALRAGRTDVAASLKAGAREGGGRRSTIRTALMAAQTALAMLLLLGAGVFVQSLSRVQALDLGFEDDRVVVLSPRWPRLAASASEAERASEAQRREQFAADMLGQLSGTSGIEHAAAAVGVPFGNSYGLDVRLPGRDSLPQLSGGLGMPGVSAVSADYFATVGTRLLRGRLFSEADRAGSEPVAVVSETMARVLWPGANFLSECLLIGKDKTCTRVIGAVADVRHGRILNEPVMHYYVPLGQQQALSGPELLVRPRGSAEAAIPRLKAMLRTLDPTISFVDGETLQDRISPQLRTWRIGAMMFTVFGALALVVAAVGTFSVVAYLVEQRRHEIGVRRALGGRARHITTLMVRGALGATVGGVALGTAIGVAGGHFVEPLLYETSVRDPFMLAAVAATLLVVATLASTVPALRARHVDPMTALREE